MGRARCWLLFGGTDPNVAYANGFELAKYPMRFRIAHLANSFCASSIFNSQRGSSRVRSVENWSRVQTFEKLHPKGITHGIDV